MKKNVKGFIGLFAGIGALVLTGAALFIPTAQISGTSVFLYGNVNIALALGAAALSIVAIVFGILSHKNSDNLWGPRKAGTIVGVFAVLIALAASGVCALTSSFVDYANGKPGNAIAQMDEADRKPIDDALAQLRADRPAD